jgi:hypothetical protein
MHNGGSANPLLPVYGVQKSLWTWLHFLNGPGGCFLHRLQG